MGDLINCATIDSPSSPFQQNLTLSEQIEEVVKLLSPIKNKILGAIDGNHEQRLIRYSGYSPTISICDRLGISYMGSSGIVICRLGCRKASMKSPRESFVGYFHHTTGGGRTIGGKMNRVAMLRDILPNADFYCGGHNHMLGVTHNVTQMINSTTGQVDIMKQMFIDCGGYLEWKGSYAETMMLQPLKIGSPRVHLIVKRKRDGISRNHQVTYKDVHVSL
jgi:hypothetical protein